MTRSVLLLLLLLLTPLGLYSQVPPEVVQGVTVSTHTSGREWGSEAIGQTFEEIQKIGANWVAIHPYARIGADGSVTYRPFDPAHPPEYLKRPIREAHERGLSILIKPHLAYWGSPFAWRGEIQFGEDAAAWRRFFDQYGAWIRAVAEATSRADGFVVGTELDATIQHETEWRRLVAEVRQRTDAPLTYAANWTDFRRVPFWDALDVIGIQAYFPLSEAESPDHVQLSEAWRERMAELRSFGTAQDRRVLFTELGYNRSFDAARRPWDYRTDGPEAEGLQLACMQSALEAVAAEPWVVGVFLWKWFPEPRPVGRNFQLATPRMRRLVARYWRPERVGLSSPPKDESRPPGRTPAEMAAWEWPVAAR